MLIVGWRCFDSGMAEHKGDCSCPNERAGHAGYGLPEEVDAVLRGINLGVQRYIRWSVCSKVSRYRSITHPITDRQDDSQ